MKRCRTILFSLVLFCLVGYTGFWLWQAHRLKSSVKEALSYQNYGVEIEYDTLLSRGFPLEIQIQIEKPRLKIPAGFSRSLNYTSEGRINTTFSLQGELKSIDSTGISQLYFSGKKAKKWQIESQMHVNLLANGATFLLQDVNISRQEQPYSHIDNLQVDIVRTSPSPDRQLIQVDFAMKGHERIMPSQPEDLKTEKGAWTYLKDLFSVKRGKTNNSFTIKADLPSQEVLQKLMSFPALLLQEKWPYVNVDVVAVHSKDDLSSYSGDLHFKFGQEADDLFTFQMSSGGSLHFSSNLYDSLVDMLGGIDLEVDLKPLVPKFHEFGTIINKWKSSFDLNKSQILSLSGLEGTIRLSDIEFTSDLYGIRIGAEVTNLNQPFTVYCSVDVLNFRRLINDLVGYYNRVYSIFNVLQVANVPPLYPLTDETVAKVLAYLDQIGSEPSQNVDLSLKFTYRDGKMQLGELDEERLSAQTQALWKAILQNIAPELVPPEPVQPTPK